MKHVIRKRFASISESCLAPYGGGQHHLTESCGITKAKFENIVSKAHQIFSEKTVEPQLAEESAYYLKLYQIYFKWQRNNRDRDFYELCMKKGTVSE